MARIRHRIRSRRGGSRGRSIRPPATPSPEPSSPSSSPSITHSHGTFFGRYPDTRSSRGRSQLHGDCRMNVVVHTANFRPPPHPSPHTTQFRFHSSLPRPVITATVTITFIEEINQQEAQTRNSGEQQRAAQRNRNARDPGKQQMVENSATPHGEELVGSQHATTGRAGGTKVIGDVQGDTSGKHAAEGNFAGTQTVCGISCGASAEEQDWYEYVRRIVEEPPSDNF